MISVSVSVETHFETGNSYGGMQVTMPNAADAL